MAPRGILLAGGKGTRLGDLTRTTNKHLLPVGGEPMILHPLRKLQGAGVTDVLLVTGREHVSDFVRLLGDGRALGCALTYQAQEDPGGVAQALGLAEAFCAGQRCVVLLGDNVFEAPLGPLLGRMNERPDHAWVALTRVADPLG